MRRACQVLYRPGRGNGELKARVPVARRDLKEAGDKPLARRTGIVTVQAGGPVLRQGGIIGRPAKTELRASITRRPFLRIVEI